MKIFSIFFILLTLIVSQPLFAHSEHGHGPISESTALTLALDVANYLSSQDAGLGFGQLPKTWASIPVKNISISKKGKGYYIVSVNNEKENNTLHILMSDGGDVYDANFTGEFEGIN
ncbi:MAG: hypothetical protein ACI845_001585 [Gammaproteobacteria bacterium]|jgi:hypothetical protein